MKAGVGLRRNMRYFVTLNDQQFPLTLEPASGGRQRLASARAATAEPGREMSAEILRPRLHGKPALVRVDGRLFRVLADAPGGPGRPRSAAIVAVNGRPVRVLIETELDRRARPVLHPARISGVRITAPMPGRVVEVNVQVGDRVVAGTPLVSVEAMKMENALQAPGTGRVLSVAVSAGATVEADQELLVIAPEP